MNRTLYLVLLVTVALTACAGAPVERIVNVDTPVAVPCDVKTPQKPAMPMDALQVPYTGDRWTASSIGERTCAGLTRANWKPRWRRVPRRWRPVRAGLPSPDA
jgi:hypothetical protein